jgi:pyruvate/2-oxoglutarate dehydrogenase complex dihydrolipoamide acyltransferase (E2) component
LKEIIAPKENADDKVIIKKLFFKNKDKVSKSDEIIELETSKTAIALEADIDGFIEYTVKPNASVGIGDVIIKIHDTDEFIPKEIKSNTNNNENKVIDKVITKDAQLYIQENKIDISSIQKTVIKLSDVLEINKKDDSNKRLNDDFLLSSFKSDLPIKKIPLSLSKKTEIAALSSIQSGHLVSTIFYNLDDCDFFKNDNDSSSFSNNVLSIITHEVSQLLKKYPKLNSYYLDNNIMQYEIINLGIAIDIDDGLKVFTIRNSDKLDLKSIKKEIAQGIYTYLRKNLTTNQITGSTFTITDLSSYGVDKFVPLINYKQSAILGLSSIDKKLNRLTLSLSFDHRVTEGKLATNFLSDLCKNLKKNVAN